MTIPVFDKFISAFGGLLFDPRTPVVIAPSGALTLTDALHSGRFVNATGDVVVSDTLPDGFLTYLRNDRSSGDITITVSGNLAVQGDLDVSPGETMFLVKGAGRLEIVPLNAQAVGSAAVFPPTTFETITGDRVLVAANDRREGFVASGTAPSLTVTLPPSADSSVGDFYTVTNQLDSGNPVFVEPSGSDNIAGEVSADLLLSGHSSLYVYRGNATWQKLADAQEQVIPPWPLSHTLTPGSPLNILAGPWVDTFRNTVIQGGGSITLPSTVAAAVAVGTGIRVIATSSGGIGIFPRNPTESIGGNTPGANFPVLQGQEVIIYKRNQTSQDWAIFYQGPARPLSAGPATSITAGVLSWAGLDRAINQNEIQTTLDSYGYVRNPDPSGLLTQATATGNRVDLSSNVFINAANVVTSQVAAAPAMFSADYSVSGQTLGTQQQITLLDGSGNQLRFSDFTGGTLTMMVQFSAISFSGFVPELVSLSYTYGAGPSARTFTFPLDTIDAAGQVATLRIAVPSEDYTAILNDTPVVVLTVNERGASFRGTVTIAALVNSRTGPLHDPVINLIDTEITNVSARLDAELAQLRGEEGDFEAGVRDSLAAINPRISPLRDEVFPTPETTNAFYAPNPGGTGGITLSGMTQVHPDSPTFVAGATAMFVAAPVTSAGANYTLENTTQATMQTLSTLAAGTDPNLEILGSEFFNGTSFAIYRVTGIPGVNDVFRVNHNSTRPVVVWQQAIDDLQSQVAEIRQALDTPLLDIPADVVSVLAHDVTVAQETAPLEQPSDYNRNLGAPAAGTAPKVLRQNPATSAPSSGVVTTNPIITSPTTTRGRKLFISHNHTLMQGDIVLTASGGSTTLARVDGTGTQLNASVVVPAVPPGTQTVTVYPAPSNRVSGAGIWQTIPLLTFVNGVPVPEADELFFTRNIPSAPATLSIQYRGHANGNIFSSGATTLANVGGSSEVFTTFVLDDGSEQATIEVRYYPNSRSIRVSGTERVQTGLPTISDVEVILSFNETRTTAGRPATTRDVPLSRVGPQGNNFAVMVKPSTQRVSGDGPNNPTAILVGNLGEVDTGYAYDTLFGDGDTGTLSFRGETLSIYDVQDSINVTRTLLQEFEARDTLPNDGFFTEDHTHATVVSLDTQFAAENAQGDSVTLGNIVNTLATDTDSPGTTYRITGIDVTGGTAVLRVEVVS